MMDRYIGNRYYFLFFSNMFEIFHRICFKEIMSEVPKWMVTNVTSFAKDLRKVGP